MIPAGWVKLPRGTSGDDICDQMYIQDHPKAAAEDGLANPFRAGWLPGQSKAFTGDQSVYLTRKVQAPMAAWTWTCGPREQGGLYQTWEQLNWFCRLNNPTWSQARAWTDDQDDAYSWTCIGPSTG